MLSDLGSLNTIHYLIFTYSITSLIFNMDNKYMTGPESYNSTQLASTDADDNRVRNMTQCFTISNFHRDKEVDCPKNAYLDFGCVDDIGRDLLYGRPINKLPLPDDTRLALEQSTFAKWKLVSQEACTKQRFAAAESKAVAKLRQEIAAKNTRQ